MATISKEMAEKIIAKNGWYPGDPRISKVVTYTSISGETCYAIIYPQEDQQRYETSPYCLNVKTIWKAT